MIVEYFDNNKSETVCTVQNEVVKMLKNSSKWTLIFFNNSNLKVDDKDIISVSHTTSDNWGAK